jgi:hypothetical protein
MDDSTYTKTTEKKTEKDASGTNREEKVTTREETREIREKPEREAMVIIEEEED